MISFDVEFVYVGYLFRSDKNVKCYFKSTRRRVIKIETSNLLKYI